MRINAAQVVLRSPKVDCLLLRNRFWITYLILHNNYKYLAQQSQVAISSAKVGFWYIVGFGEFRSAPDTAREKPAACHRRMMGAAFPFA